ncbi:MAG TPA: hypothetical protein VN722_08470 [Hanamia sp.]|nr:hypothetical protein [Hanamia sp.]
MIYDVNFNPIAVEQLPPDKRYTNNVATLQSLLNPLQWIRDLFFGSYYGGATCPIYAPGTYNYLDQVIYNKKVYSSLINNNTGAPTTANWELVQDNFIGLQERLLYNGQKLVLEYALNKEYNRVFRQPPNTSDIFINTNPYSAPIFIIGLTEDKSSTVSTIGSSEFVGLSDGVSSRIDSTVNIPSAVYSAQGGKDNIFRNFIDQYMPAGITYKIQTY